MKFNFASDSVAPVWPEIMKKFEEVNKGYEIGYSQDKYTKQLREKMQSYFTKPVECHFCIGGGAASHLAIKSMKQNYSAIICCEDTHINKFEVGSTEFGTGCKILACDSPDAKLTIRMISEKLKTVGDFHSSLPTIVAITQMTEYGTVYTTQEIKEICDFCHQNNLYVYIDGARIANAMVYLNASFKEMFEDTGVDVVSFGGNKSGFMFGEMLIYLNTSLAKNFILNQRQSMHLFSKTRFLSCQFLVMLEDDLWRKKAGHSNSMAIYFRDELKKCGVKIALPVQGNAVLAEFSEKQLEHINKEYSLSTHYIDTPYSRLSTNWTTKKQEIDEFIDFLKSIK